MEENEIIYNNIPLAEEQEEVTIEEVMPTIEVTEIERYDIEMLEAFPSAEGDTSYNHALLNNREIHDAHPIVAITGLREELDSIEALQTVYSDKKGNADYYEWADGLALGKSGVGHFVTLNKNPCTISICTGDDIFGVVVESAAFVGGQDDASRDIHYGLVATSGVVNVKCELDVAEGDYVVSNSYGIATKAISNCGYRVVTLHDINGEPHATIMLGISADQIDSIGIELQELDSRMDAAETNIVSAINVANEAYKRAGEVGESNKVMSDKVNGALDKVDRLEDGVENMGSQVSNSALISAQAKAISEEASRLADEAVGKANESLDETSNLRDQLGAMKEGITEIEDQVTIVTKKINGRYEIVDTISDISKEESTVYYAKDTETYYYCYDYDIPAWAETTNPREAGLLVAIAGIQVETDENSASINNLVSWQGDVNISMARIEQKADANGAYIQSTVSNIDKYTVGPRSQAYGFTLEQAASILEEDMIYVPTMDLTGDNAERYQRVSEATAYPKDNSDLDIAQVYYTSTIGANGESVKTYHYWSYNESTEQYEWLTTSTFPIYDSREFSQGNLYRWGVLSSGLHGWTTVDKNYSENKLNTSAPTVYFSHREIDMYKPDNNINYGYWYTDTTDENPVILDVDGNETNDYSPHTLYKWDLLYKYKNKDGETDVEERHWVAVASLVGNASNRAISQIRQDANSLTAEIVNAYGSTAGLGARLSETESTVQALAIWKEDADTSIATLQNKADATGASVAMIAENIGGCETWDGISERDTSKIYYSQKDKKYYFYKEGEWVGTENAVEAGVEINAASIVTAVTDDDSAISMLANNIKISADNVEFTATADYTVLAQNISLDASQITLGGSTLFTTAQEEDGTTRICGDFISTGSIEASQIDTSGLTANEIWVTDNSNDTIFRANAARHEVYLSGHVVIGDPESESPPKMGDLIKSYTIKYASIDPDKEPDADTVWADKPSWVVGKYIWQQTVIKYIDGRDDTVTTVCIQGAKGEDGASGADAYTVILTNESHTFTQQVSSKATTQILAYKGSAMQSVTIVSVNGVAATTTATGTGMTGFAFSCSTLTGESPTITFTFSGSFAHPNGTIPIVIEVDGIRFTKMFTYSIALRGAAGAASSSYWLVSNASVIQKTSGDSVSYIPAELTFTGKRKTGSGTPTDYACRWILEFTEDGSTYQGMTSGVDEVSKTFALTDNDGTNKIKAVRARMYLAGGTTTLLDEQIIPIVSDGAEGASGSAGLGVVDVYPEYLFLQDEEEPLDWDNYFGWTDNFDDVLSQYWESEAKKKYIWSRERVVYDDGSTSVSTRTCQSAAAAIAAWCETNDITQINGDVLVDGSITAKKIATNALQSVGYDSGNGDDLTPADGYSDTGTFFDMANGAIYAPKFYLGTDGSIHAKDGFFSGHVTGSTGEIGGWSINQAGLIGRENNVGLCAGWSGDPFYYFSKTANTDISLFVGVTDIDTKDFDFLTYGNGTVEANFMVTAQGDVYTGALTVNGQSIFNDDSTFNQSIVCNNNLTIAGDNGASLYVTHREDSPTSPNIHLYNGNIAFYNDNNSVYSAIYTNNASANLWGTWTLNSDTIQTSWRGAKHDIEALPDEYSILFDNLQPVRYKYNDGQSDRYHTGFILDEMKNAMDIASVDASEFAAYCVANKETGEGGIRYSELIALNVAETQKLKAHATELETKVVELEAKLNELTQQND